MTPLNESPQSAEKMKTGLLFALLPFSFDILRALCRLAVDYHWCLWILAMSIQCLWGSKVGSHEEVCGGRTLAVSDLTLFQCLLTGMINLTKTVNMLELGKWLHLTEFRELWESENWLDSLGLMEISACKHLYCIYLSSFFSPPTKAVPKDKIPSFGWFIMQNLRIYPNLFKKADKA